MTVYDEYYDEFILTYKTLETDIEYRDRLAQLDRIKENKKLVKIKKEEDELKELQRLKKKYEKN